MFLNITREEQSSAFDSRVPFNLFSTAGASNAWNSSSRYNQFLEFSMVEEYTFYLHQQFAWLYIFSGGLRDVQTVNRNQIWNLTILYYNRSSRQTNRYGLVYSALTKKPTLCKCCLIMVNPI